MAKTPASVDLSSPESNGESMPFDGRQNRSSKRSSRKNSIKNYVHTILHKQGQTDEQPTNVTISTSSKFSPKYENLSAFRRIPTNPSQQNQDSSSEDEIRDYSSTTQVDDSMTQLNLDPNPLFEQRESEDQVYKQKVYLRQLQPPTPQPIEIQVQEVLIKPQGPKPPLHVRVGQREPRTPSPIIIKTAPPPPPSIDSTKPIIYNKYLPPPKQPPQQIIIHQYPELPPKPRPIVVEQWLPYKPAPKRIIKHSLPPEALRSPSPPHNVIVAYSKPRAVIEVELVRLPVVKIDPQTYQQMTVGGQKQLLQSPIFQHEQEYLFSNKSSKQINNQNQINWRI